MMDEINANDLNSLNAIAGALRCMGYDGAANVLLNIQGKLSCANREVKYLKTSNVTNTKNVVVQIPTWIVRQWGLAAGDKLEVLYDKKEDKVFVCKRPE